MRKLDFLLSREGQAFLASRPALPEPSGRYRTGVTRFELSQPERLQRYLDVPVRMELFAFYPTDSGDGEGIDYFDDDSIIDSYNELFAGKKDLCGYLRGLRIDSVRDAPLREKRGGYKAVIISQGMGGAANSLFGLCRELASRGFVALAFNTAGDSFMTTFAGEKIPRSPGYNEEMAESLRAMREKAASDGFEDAESANFLNSEYGYALLRDNMPAAETCAADRVEDMRFIADTLQRGLRSGALDLTGSVDCERLGAAGHSLGGCTSYFALCRDRRFACGANIDGMLFGKRPGDRAKKPYMLINSGTGKDVMMRDYQPGEVARRKIFDGVSHPMLCDLLYMAREYRQLAGMDDTADGETALPELYGSIADFFEENL